LTELLPRGFASCELRAMQREIVLQFTPSFSQFRLTNQAQSCSIMVINFAGNHHAPVFCEGNKMAIEKSIQVGHEQQSVVTPFQAILKELGKDVQIRFS
jgi:hypothetical protein